MIELLAAGSLYLSPGALSWHADKGYNELNAGIGVEYRTGDHVIAAGMYRNSIRQDSRYLTYGWLPLKTSLGPVQIAAGGAIGIVDGYQINKGRAIPVALPMVSADWGNFGVNLTAWPAWEKSSAGVAVQFRFKIW